MPSYAAASLNAYATRNASNMLFVVLLDILICSLVLMFLAGFRGLISETQPSSIWLATQVFGAGMVFTAFTLYADMLQCVIAFSALSGDPIPRSFAPFFPAATRSSAPALIFSAVLLSAASYVAYASRALPPITTWLGYCGAVACLALVPFAVVGGPNPSALLDTAHLGAISRIAVVPLALWMIAVAIAMFRTHDRHPEAH